MPLLSVLKELLDFQRFGLLCLMGMLVAAKNMQLFVHASAQWALGQHTLHRELDRAFRVLFQQLAERNALQVTNVSGVLMVELVSELGSRDPHGARIDDDNMVAKVFMRRIIRL